MCYVGFFFFKQKTAYEMVMSDWSSDVCSSDLGIYTAAPYGLVPKFGRFFSGLGYMNEQHQHAWDFIDAPLAYQAFLGGQYANDGLQVKWVAPIEHFVELGAEVGNGDNFPGSPRNKN